jgi:hypothetical protein
MDSLYSIATRWGGRLNFYFKGAHWQYALQGKWPGD